MSPFDLKRQVGRHSRQQLELRIRGFDHHGIRDDVLDRGGSQADFPNLSLELVLGVGVYGERDRLFRAWASRIIPMSASSTEANT